MFDVLDPLLEDLFGRLLQLGIEGRVDAQPALIDALPAEPLDEILANLLLEIEPERFPDLEPVRQPDRLAARRLVLRSVDRSRSDHRLQDDVAARDGAIEVHRRRVTRRRLNQSREQRGVGDAEIAGGFPEVPARRRFDAVQAVAEVHLVQVQLEDLLLGVLVLDARGEDHFFHLAPQRLVAREEALARELLRDRAAALRAPPEVQVAQERGADADDVDPTVLEEPLILDREHRLDQVWRDLLERHLEPLLLINREHRHVARVEDGGRLGHLPKTANHVTPG